MDSAAIRWDRTAAARAAAPGGRAAEPGVRRLRRRVRWAPRAAPGLVARRPHGPRPRPARRRAGGRCLGHRLQRHDRRPRDRCRGTSPGCPVDRGGPPALAARHARRRVLGGDRINEVGQVAGGPRTGGRGPAVRGRHLVRRADDRDLRPHEHPGRGARHRRRRHDRGRVRDRGRGRRSASSPDRARTRSRCGSCCRTTPPGASAGRTRSTAGQVVGFGFHGAAVAASSPRPPTHRPRRTSSSTPTRTWRSRSGWSAPTSTPAPGCRGWSRTARPTGRSARSPATRSSTRRSPASTAPTPSRSGPATAGCAPTSPR